MPLIFTQPKSVSVLEPVTRNALAAKLSRITINLSVALVLVEVTADYGVRNPDGSFKVYGNVSGNLSGDAAKALLAGGLGARLEEHLLTWMSTNGLLPQGTIA